MSRAAKILLGMLALLAAAGTGAFLWLTARQPVPDRSDYGIDLPALRALASSIPGALPTEVASALFAEAALPRGAVFAGESLREPHPMVHQVFEVRGGASDLVIDVGFTRSQLEKMGAGGRFDEAAWQQVLAAMRRADRIVVTHEHFDHLGGAAAYEPVEELAAKLALNRAQLANQSALDDAGFPAALRSLEPLPDEPLRAIAPGVVLVKAAGHTPGSQLVYVRLADEREYLFVGDVAWHLDQLTKLHYRPRLVTDLLLGEDRRAVLAQFRALHELMRGNPQLLLVVSHDRDQRERMVAAGLLHDGL